MRRRPDVLCIFNFRRMTLAAAVVASAALRELEAITMASVSPLLLVHHPLLTLADWL